MIKVWTDTDFALQGLTTAFSPEVVAKVLDDVMAGARAKWIQLAGAQLHSSRRDYINGIMEVDTVSIGKKHFSYIALVGEWPNMLEDGFDAFDMHDTLLGPNASGKKQLANGEGFYRSIPFRQQTPGTIGQGGGQVMGAAYEGHPLVQNAEELGLAVHSLAVNLQGSKDNAFGKTEWGGRLPPGLAPKLKEHHSTDLFAGMTRHEKTYENATQNTFFTFRTISDNVKDKWLHPGFSGVHIADQVGEYVDKVAPLAFKAML